MESSEAARSPRKFRSPALCRGFACGLAAGVGCAGAPGEGHLSAEAERLGHARAGIVRAVAPGGPKGVVFLLRRYAREGQFEWAGCSGTLIGPRTVATAAHCLDELDRAFVYFGDHFAEDFAKLEVLGGLPTVPAPGAPGSRWARVESALQHPKWSRDLIFPDLGLVYLDRALPIEPVPLRQAPVGQWLEGSQVTLAGWGAKEVISRNPDVPAGGETLRTGVATLLGAPTAADYRPEDPNLGLLQPGIPAQQLLLDGAAPDSNTCYGDSGGALLINEGGQFYLAGVNYWSGLGCEEYSLATRVFPFLESFFRPGLERGGRRPVRPKAECVQPRADGSYRAYLGYDNENLVSLSIPTGGWRNQLAVDTELARPTLFLPGRHRFVAAVDVPANRSLSWQLVPESGWGDHVAAHPASSRSCGPADALDIACLEACSARVEAARALECGGSLTRLQCLRECQQVGALVERCGAEYLALQRCQGASPAGWECSSPSGAFTPACGDQEDALFDCLWRP